MHPNEGYRLAEWVWSCLRCGRMEEVANELTRPEKGDSGKREAGVAEVRVPISPLASQLKTDVHSKTRILELNTPLESRLQQSYRRQYARTYDHWQRQYMLWTIICRVPESGGGHACSPNLHDSVRAIMQSWSPKRS